MKTLSEYNNIQQDDILNEGLFSFIKKLFSRSRKFNVVASKSLMSKFYGKEVGDAMAQFWGDYDQDLEKLEGDDYINAFMKSICDKLDLNEKHSKDKKEENTNESLIDKIKGKDKEGTLCRWKGYDEEYINQYPYAIKLGILSAFDSLINKYKDAGKESNAQKWQKQLDIIKGYKAMKDVVTDYTEEMNKIKEEHPDKEDNTEGNNEDLPANKKEIKNVIDKVCSKNYQGGDEKAVRKILITLYNLHKNSKSTDKDDWDEDELETILTNIIKINPDTGKFKLKEKKEEKTQESLCNSYLENIIKESSEDKPIENIKNNMRNALLVSLGLEEFETEKDKERFNYDPSKSGISDIINSIKDDNIRKDIQKIAGIESKEEPKKEDNKLKDTIKNTISDKENGINKKYNEEEDKIKHLLYTLAGAYNTDKSTEYAENILSNIKSICFIEQKDGYIKIWKEIEEYYINDVELKVSDKFNEKIKKLLSNIKPNEEGNSKDNAKKLLDIIKEKFDNPLENSENNDSSSSSDSILTEFIDKIKKNLTELSSDSERRDKILVSIFRNKNASKIIDIWNNNQDKIKKLLPYNLMAESKFKTLSNLINEEDNNFDLKEMAKKSLDTIKTNGEKLGLKNDEIEEYKKWLKSEFKLEEK